MGFRDHSYDVQPETKARSARLRAASERLEDPRQEFGWDRFPLVAHREAHTFRVSMKRDVDRGIRRAVMRGIVDEIGHGLGYP